MPLDNDHVTLGTRVMLPTYVIFSGGIGLGLLFTPLSRLLQTPTLAYANERFPLPGWGVIFVAVAVILLVAKIFKKRTAAMVGLSMLLLWVAVYTAMCLAAAHSGDAAWSSWLWPFFVTRACWASLLSLAAREH